jgi:hypothetical protein
MPTLRRTAVREAAVAREQVAPALQKAQETLSDTVLPAVRDALAIAREKSEELLDSDAALEAKRRGRAVVQAARGNVVAVPKARRWRFGLGMVALGAMAGFGVTYARRFLSRPATGAGTGEAFPAFPSGTEETDTTATNDGIDLRAGSGAAPTTS